MTMDDFKKLIEEKGPEEAMKIILDEVERRLLRAEVLLGLRSPVKRVK